MYDADQIGDIGSMLGKTDGAPPQYQNLRFFLVVA